MNQMTEKEAWALLEIPPDSSKRDIRRAYAALAKDCHPEEDPEGFARLQEAYRRALEASGQKEQERERSQLEKSDEQEKISEYREADNGEASEEEAAPSLLKRLQAETDRQRKDSLSYGALGRLKSLLQEESCCKKTALWKEFFLSEEFLSEQMEDSFCSGLSLFLEEFDLPWQFVAELMLAYGIGPEDELLLLEEFGAYPAAETRGLAGRQAAGRAWWEQEDNREQIFRYLARPENQVRLRAFSDYWMMKSRNQQGYLTEQEQESWKEIVGKGEFSYLYEQNNGQFTKYTRSECVITLYAHWIRTEAVPSCVCRFMYQRYRLKDLEHSSAKAVYQSLKEAILAKYPKLEEELFGEEGRIQQISRWYQDLMRIVGEYHNAYEKREYGENEELRTKIARLFQREEWKQYCYDDELFRRMYMQLANRKVLPPTLASYLYRFYKEEMGSSADLEQKLSVLLETMVRSFAFGRQLLEQDYRRPYTYQGTKVEDITLENQAFWTYYLMNGFGARYGERIGSLDNQAEYVRWNRYYLPAYIRSVYLPSLEWAKRFTRFDEEEMLIRHPVWKEVPFPVCGKAPEGGILQLEFHLHYVTYRLNGISVIEPLLSWRELVGHMQDKKEETELFFFWLAVTAIEEEEHKEAEEIVLHYLKNLPLASVTLDVIAGALAADNARTEQPEKPERKIQAVYYEEQERFCFKAEVFFRGMKLYRQTDFGWEETTLLPGEGKKAKALDLEGKKQFAIAKLKQMRQPKPKLVEVISLDTGGEEAETLANLEKAIQVIEGLKEQECYSRKRTKAYFPGFPWSPDQITDPVKEFFAAYGGWMTEAFVVLHIGQQPKKCFDRIFYSAMNIFGFDLYFHSKEHSGSLQFRESELARKIKEKHLIVGRLGWGEEYEALGGFAPIPFAIGESGCFYAYDGLHLIRKSSFPELVAGCYDFTEITAMKIYDTRLTVSKLDHKLEYCYTREDFEKWLNRKNPMLEETFTKFGI